MGFQGQSHYDVNFTGCMMDLLLCGSVISVEVEAMNTIID